MTDFAALTSTISIVLGVLTYFLTMVLEKSRSVLRETIPAGNTAREDFRKGLFLLLAAGWLPLVLSFGLLFYLCLPTVVSIQQTSRFQVWSFDLMKTLFIFLHLGIGACLVIAIVVGVLLFQKLWRSY
jgi:hypothetical protein